MVIPNYPALQGDSAHEAVANSPYSTAIPCRGFDTALSLYTLPETTPYLFTTPRGWSPLTSPLNIPSPSNEMDRFSALQPSDPFIHHSTSRETTAPLPTSTEKPVYFGSNPLMGREPYTPARTLHSLSVWHNLIFTNLIRLMNHAFQYPKKQRELSSMSWKNSSPPLHAPPSPLPHLSICTISMLTDYWTAPTTQPLCLLPRSTLMLVSNESQNSPTTLGTTRAITIPNTLSFPLCTQLRRTCPTRM